MNFKKYKDYNFLFVKSYAGGPCFLKVYYLHDMNILDLIDQNSLFIFEYMTDREVDRIRTLLENYME